MPLDKSSVLMVPTHPLAANGFLLTGRTFRSLDVPGSVDTVARGINNRAQIVGDFLAADGARRGFLLSAGTYATIEPPGNGSSAHGINDSGQIVGLSGSGPGATAFLFTVDRDIRDLVVSAHHGIR